MDDCTFWYTQEYYAVTSEAGWQTRIGSFSLPNCHLDLFELPVVSVAASTPTATEAGPTNGAFTITRTSDLSLPLTVHYTVGGNATPGADYRRFRARSRFRQGHRQRHRRSPRWTTVVESNESVIVSLTPNAAYLLGSAAQS